MTEVEGKTMSVSKTTLARPGRSPVASIPRPCQNLCLAGGVIPPGNQRKAR